MRQFGGNALSADVIPTAVAYNMLSEGGDTRDYDANTWAQNDLDTLQPGQIGGIVVDPNGAVVPNADVTVTNTQTGASLRTKSDGDGHWVIAGLQPGAVAVNITASGFKGMRQDLQLHASQPARMGTTLQVGTVSETVTVTADGSPINSRQIEQLAIQKREAQLNMISPNVTSLQRRVAGILPVAIEVPKSGKSYRFVRPLVLEEETRVTFQYKSR